MRHITLRIVIALLIVPLLLSEAWTEPDNDLRRRIESARGGYHMTAGGEPLRAQAALMRFYERNGYEPVWTGRRHEQRMAQLIAAIKGAENEGLDPSAYHLAALRAAGPEKRRRDRRTAGVVTAAVIDRELLATDAFLTLAKHYATGRLNPRTIDGDWHISPDEVVTETTLTEAIASGRIEKALVSLLPLQQDYELLRKALASYRAIRNRGGWDPIASGPKLELGGSGERVVQLKQRLAASGDYPGNRGAFDPVFDNPLKEAVMRFQRRANIEPDGVVGPRTLRELNKSVDERIAQIRVNMERWRWLPQDLGQSHILVNMADFRLFLVQNNRIVLEKPVIVGRNYRKTPVFSGSMTYLVFNPWWEIPRRIAVEDKLPAFQKNPALASTQGYEILSGWGADAKSIDPGSVNWSSHTKANFPYRIRQRPGEQNALGRVKFMLPNQFSVYLHDTPTRELFDRQQRDFSSGCIRVKDPMELAQIVLKENGDWSRQKIDAVVASGKTTTVNLKRPLPVHLLYWTTVAGEDGKDIRLINDVYDRDQRVFQALIKTPD